MLRIIKLTFLILVCCTIVLQTYGSGNSKVYITLKNPTILSYVTLQGKPIFTVAGVNTIIKQYSVTGFEKAYPTSRFQLMRKIYKMDVSDTALCVALVSNYPQYFPGWELVPQFTSSLFYTPNDYIYISGMRNTGYLDSIYARNAWDYSKGDSNIVIGIHDWGIDTNHDDLKNKFANKLYANYLYGLNEHGTRTSGIIAGETNNNTNNMSPYGYYPSIGFNCKLDYVGCTGMPGAPVPIEQICPGFLQTSQRNRKVISFSAGHYLKDTLYYPNSWDFINTEMMYQEIYEHGTFFVAAAGNGNYNGIPSHYYAFPSSYDYVFSVSGVGWKNPRVGYTTNVSGSHEEIIGDTMKTFQHNSRVDLLAPAYDIGGLNSNNVTTEITRSGTSLAAPLVAGTAGLILSLDSCYTPYQLEYILKKTANSSILTYPENLPFAGKLGSGSLNAGKALSTVNKNTSIPTLPGVVKTSCNDPLTTTMYIDGVEFNTLCVPGFNKVNGLLPKLTPIIKNGKAPYTARWEPLNKLGNLCALNSYTTFSPEIVSAVALGAGGANGSFFLYRLTVYDNSPIQKVASRIIEMDLTSGGYANNIDYELTARDAYMDMLNEPNTMDTLDRRVTQFYTSPDLWNRKTGTVNYEHQWAEYDSSATDSNYIFIRVRNTGCKMYNAATSQHYVKLYWTVASTGEKWKNDWDGTTKLPGSAGGYVPGGGELTTGYGIPIHDLEPGETAIIRRGWKPPNPYSYTGMPYAQSDLNVCLLARIVTTANAGMAFAEQTGPIITNVRNNNNIVTRNLWVKDLYLGKPKTKTMVLIANANDVSKTFDIQLINDKAIHLHFAGNFSEVGYIKLYLGDLYDLWMNAGGEGSYVERDDDEKTVTMDGSSTLELLNVPLAVNAKYPVFVEFNLHSGILPPEYQFTFHLRQFENNDGIRAEDVYGSMSFQINTHAPAGERNANTNTLDEASSKSNRFRIHPNPVNDQISVSYLGDEEKVVTLDVYDITGRKLISKANQHFQNSFVELNVSNFVSGVYFINVINGKDVNERFKFIKQ